MLDFLSVLPAAEVNNAILCCAVRVILSAVQLAASQLQSCRLTFEARMKTFPVWLEADITQSSLQQPQDMIIWWAADRLGPLHPTTQHTRHPTAFISPSAQKTRKLKYFVGGWSISGLIGDLYSGDSFKHCYSQLTNRAIISDKSVDNAGCCDPPPQQPPPARLSLLRTADLRPTFSGIFKNSSMDI